MRHTKYCLLLHSLRARKVDELRDERERGRGRERGENERQEENTNLELEGGTKRQQGCPLAANDVTKGRRHRILEVAFQRKREGGRDRKGVRKMGEEKTRKVISLGKKYFERNPQLAISLD